MTRTERVAEILKKEISEIFQKKLQDPRVGFVSITDVEVSADLKEAKIYVSIFANDEDKKKESMVGLHCAESFIRGELSRKLEMRFVPQITFVRDDSLERADRIFRLMQKTKENK